LAICFSQVALLDCQTQAAPSWYIHNCSAYQNCGKQTERFVSSPPSSFPFPLTFIALPLLLHALRSVPDIDVTLLPSSTDLEIFPFRPARVLSLLPVCLVGFSMVTGRDGRGAVVVGFDIPGQEGRFLWRVRAKADRGVEPEDGLQG